MLCFGRRVSYVSMDIWIFVTHFCSCIVRLLIFLTNTRLVDECVKRIYLAPSQAIKISCAAECTLEKWHIMSYVDVSVFFCSLFLLLWARRRCGLCVHPRLCCKYSQKALSPIHSCHINNARIYSNVHSKQITCRHKNIIRKRRQIRIRAIVICSRRKLCYCCCCGCCCHRTEHNTTTEKKIPAWHYHF